MYDGLPCVDVARVLVWWVLNCGVYRAIWRVVLWRWLMCIVGSDRRLSVHRLVCFVFGKLVRKMIPKSSLCFLCCMVWVVVWFGLHFRIYVYCLECSMLMLRFDYLFWRILYVLRGVSIMCTFSDKIESLHKLNSLKLYHADGDGFRCFLVIV